MKYDRVLITKVPGLITDKYIDTEGTVWYENKQKELIPAKVYVTKWGFPTIGLRGYNVNGNKIQRNMSIQQLVALHFLPNPDNKKYVIHVDGNKLNNCVDNLLWATHQEQMFHTFRDLRKGVVNIWSKNLVTGEIKSWDSMTICAEELGLDEHSISVAERRAVPLYGYKFSRTEQFNMGSQPEPHKIRDKFQHRKRVLQEM